MCYTGNCFCESSSGECTFTGPASRYPCGNRWDDQSNEDMRDDQSNDQLNTPEDDDA